MINNKVIFFDRVLSNKKVIKKPYILQLMKGSTGYVVRKKYIDSDYKKSFIIRRH